MAEAPWRDGSVTAQRACEACGEPLPYGRARRWCSDACRQVAYRHRHQPPPAPLPPLRSTREGTVYVCPLCGQRLVGEQRCGDCNVFARLGPGGPCPHCDEAVPSASWWWAPLAEDEREYRRRRG